MFWCVVDDVFFFKQKTAYEMRISDWSSDVCSSDLLHTNGVIFAFGGSVLFATSLYVVQRTCHVRLISDRLARFVFWGWQAAMVGAVITLPMGITQSKEYAELEWPLDILIAVVWIAYGWLF